MAKYDEQSNHYNIWADDMGLPKNLQSFNENRYIIPGEKTL